MSKTLLLGDEAIAQAFIDAGVWELGDTVEQVSIAYESTYKVMFSEDEVIVYAFKKTTLQYAAIGNESEVGVTTSLIIQRKPGTSVSYIVVDGRKYALDHKVSGAAGSLSASSNTTADADCIVIKLPAKNITITVA